MRGAPLGHPSDCFYRRAWTCSCSIAAATGASMNGRQPPWPPVVVLVSASMSLATWTGVVFAGRFLAYIRFADTAARHRATNLAVIEKYLWLANLSHIAGRSIAW